MQRRNRVIAGGALALVVIGTGAGIAIARSGGDGDRPLTGRNLERAKEAALEHTGGGTVLESESGDGGAAYSVEVRGADGRVVEVHLDRSFRVVGQETDDDGPEEMEGPNESERNEG